MTRERLPNQVRYRAAAPVRQKLIEDICHHLLSSHAPANTTGARYSMLDAHPPSHRLRRVNTCRCRWSHITTIAAGSNTARLKTAGYRYAADSLAAQRNWPTDNYLRLWRSAWSASGS